ncbi:MAG: hypothetical protein LBI82_04700 [Dysgonamonadaceae bacterium]|jgi:hypothetical protein|nr:hypothetical protein [Dysgonamonadaceae bacterium]
MKHIILIIDDELAEIEDVRERIIETGFDSYFDIRTCSCIETKTRLEDTSTLDMIIKEIENEGKKIELAIIDYCFQFEYGQNPIEAGGNLARKKVEAHNPFCEILFCSKNCGREDDIEFQRSNHIRIDKDLTPEGKKRTVKKINSAIERWTSKKVEEIIFDSTAKEKLLNSIKENKWDDIIVTTKKESATLENYFFYYKKEPYRLKELALENSLIDDYYPKITKERLLNIHDSEKYPSSLKNYYLLLYVDHFNEIRNITGEAESFLDSLFELLIKGIELQDYIIPNKGEVSSALTDLMRDCSGLRSYLHRYKISKVCCRIEKNRDDALKDFKKKLILRLIFLSAYILFNLPAKMIYYFCAQAKGGVSDEAHKEIGKCLFVYETLCSEDYTKKPFGNVYGGMIAKKGGDNDTFPIAPIGRGYKDIIEICTKYEREFLQSYYEKMKDKMKHDFFKDNIVEVEKIFYP